MKSLTSKLWALVSSLMTYLNDRSLQWQRRFYCSDLKKKSQQQYLSSFSRCVLLLGKQRMKMFRNVSMEWYHYKSWISSTQSQVLFQVFSHPLLFYLLLQGQICGLCGNYDGNGINDFTTRSQSVVENVLEFGNSWKISSTCPDAHSIKDPCSTNPYRKSWSEKQCSIINSNVFAACHSQVSPGQEFTVCR